MWLSFLSSYSKIITVVATLLGAVAAFYAVTNHYETKGYQRAVAELREASNKAIKTATDKAIKEANEQIEKALDRQQKLHDSELQRVKEEREVQTEIREVIKYVDKVEIRNECSTVSDDIIRLLNNSVIRVNRPHY